MGKRSDKKKAQKRAEKLKNKKPRVEETTDTVKTEEVVEKKIKKVDKKKKFKLAFPKNEKLASFFRKIKHWIKRTFTMQKVAKGFIIFATLALIATSILPYIL